MRIDGPFVKIYQDKIYHKVLLVLIINALFAIGSAFGIIYSKHKSRMLHIELQNINNQRSKLNTEWSRLILEKSTLTSDLRVEDIARQTINMVMPEQIEFIGP